MKKFIKSTVIVLVCLIAIVGIIYGVYIYNQSKKVAKVTSMQNYAMDDYWGDSIESYGTVASDKAQTLYLTKEQKVKEVLVKEGDYVEAGDPLITIDNSSIDIRGEELLVQQEEQRLKVSQVKLNRLLNVKPVSDASRIVSVSNECTYGYSGYATYTARENVGSYTVGSLVARIFYGMDGNAIYTSYFDNSGSNIKEQDLTVELSDPRIKMEYHSDVGSYIVSTDYYDGDDNRYLGSDIYDGEGNIIEKYDFPEGMTKEQLKEALELQNSEVANLDLNLRREKLKLQQLHDSLGSGQITAKVSGTVTKVQDPEAINYNSSFMIITGTDDYYISGSIGEFYLDQINVGDVVTVSSWETGISVDAAITEINDSPSKDGDFYSSGNSNSSAYGFRASFDKNSGIELGTAVNISITPNNQDGGLYLYSAFVRTDNTGSFVMKMNPDTQTLEKVYVSTGKKLWGSYSEIKSGDITMGDYIAFPYGNGEIEGVSCEIVDYLD